ncbi:capsule biosynthesis GfcC D2 domain-containing protein [Pantoea sp. FN060301]|uniref:capsule biosynthesis GfcC D2 domain-containing protein n=1 Tax=Pantoea sp. FN060301 TaxID=3420380 RepID=UPI003D178E6D
MKKRALIPAGMAFCVSLQLCAESQVTIFYPGTNETAVVSNAENLAQLVTSPALKEKTWWPGTAIAEKNATTAAVRQQQQLLARLKGWSRTLRAEGDSSKAAVVENVYQQIASLTVTGRQFVNLDPDAVRVRPAENRRLEGDYSLYTLQKPTTVSMAGLLVESGKVAWQPGRSLVDYLEHNDLLAGAERNIVVLIGPAGDVSEVPVAYWNRRHREPEAGSIIYVGFSSWSLPGEYQDLNQQIVSVLTHRIPD